MLRAASGLRQGCNIKRRIPQDHWRYRELKILGSNSWARSDLERLLQLAASRRLVPVIDRILPLSEGRAAISLLEDRAVFGKVVVAP